MVLGIFKSKEQRNKDKLKKELKGKISAIGQGGGRSKQATKKRLQRELKAVDAPKKERKKSYGRSATAYGTRDKVAAKIEADNKSSSKSKSKSTKVKGRKLSPYEMKKAERIQAMKDRAKKRHEAWKKEKGRK